MEHREWLMKELETWEAEGLIDRKTLQEIRGHYRSAAFRIPVKTPLFIAAGIAILIGIFLIGASFWSVMPQNHRFFLAMAPALVTLLFVAASFAWDKKTPPQKPRRDVTDEMQESLFPEEEIEETATPPDSPRSFSHTIREIICTLHGLAACGSLWLVRDTYRLDSDIFLWTAAFSASLLFLAYVGRSAGLALIATALSVYTAWNGGGEAWPEIFAWVIVALSLLQFFFLILQEREDTAIGYAWGWTAAALILAYLSGVALMWQVMFCTTAASLTWLFGAGLKRQSSIGELFRFFGSVLVFLSLLFGSYTGIWQNPDGNIFLWALFAGFLAADVYLLKITARKKEWIACLAGLSPFVVGVSALVSLWDGSGVLSAVWMSFYALLLGVFLLISSFHTGRRRQLVLGIMLLSSGGFIRLIDSTLTLAQRGVYFLFLGFAAALFCYAAHAAGKRAVARHGYGAEEEGKTHE